MRLERRIDKALKGGKKVKTRVRNIEDDTPIMPWIVADTVIEELASYLETEGPHIDAVRLWNRKDVLADQLSARANAIYKANATFRKKIRSEANHGNAGRDWLYAFMRHWLAADLKKNQPAAFRVLPSGFAMGHELR